MRLEFLEDHFIEPFVSYCQIARSEKNLKTVVTYEQRNSLISTSHNQVLDSFLLLSDNKV